MLKSELWFVAIVMSAWLLLEAAMWTTLYADSQIYETACVWTRDVRV